jgi:hypothetical protein
MTYTRKMPLKVLPPLPLKKKSKTKSKSNSKPKKSKSKSKSPKVNGPAMGNNFNNQNMPPSNPQLSRGMRFVP